LQRLVALYTMTGHYNTKKYIGEQFEEKMSGNRIIKLLGY
jgi:hypothetical protein